jgi:hypothetical protein
MNKTCTKKFSRSPVHRLDHKGMQYPHTPGMGVTRAGSCNKQPTAPHYPSKFSQQYQSMVCFPLPSSHPVPLDHQASNFPNSTTNSAASQAGGHQVPLGHQASNFPNSTTNSAASQACGHVSQWSITSKIKACEPVHLSIIVRIITSRIRENYIGSAGCINRWSST